MLPYELEQLWNEIQLAFDEGTFESPEAQAKIARFMQEGPEALDYWVDQIKQAEALALGYADRLGKLKAKKQAKETQVEKMRERMASFILTALGGKAKTPEWALASRESKTTTYRMIPGKTSDDLPPECVKVEKTLKQEEIKRRIKGGESLPVEAETETKLVLTIR